MQLTDFEAHMVDGVQYAVVADNEQSRFAFEQATALVPNDPCAENNLGVLAWRRDDREDALLHFENALKSVPDNTLYGRNRDGAQAAQADFDPQICLDVNSDLIK